MGSSSIFVVEIRERSCDRSQGPDQNSPGRGRIEQRVVLGAQRSREENTSSVGKVQAASELLGKLVKNMQQLAFDSGLRQSAMSCGGRLCWKRKGRKAVFQFACKPDRPATGINEQQTAGSALLRDTILLGQRDVSGVRSGLIMLRGRRCEPRSQCK
ncbi:hypothetical protein DCS_07944 [Drechmeria coniospora]|uniref:Uncharacterized protein n=1 Tax=Drechmeria coniospora TaxID=98403 RepID=A0A151GFV9_DRECN|nr:hypothetical protein DCS_07944 [Drechmeria coniospora]KYK55979.1 hypothetical protein DCS_07944 [Drechmeria coniospora]